MPGLLEAVRTMVKLMLVSVSPAYVFPLHPLSFCFGLFPLLLTLLVALVIEMEGTKTMMKCWFSRFYVCVCLYFLLCVFFLCFMGFIFFSPRCSSFFFSPCRSVISSPFIRPKSVVMVGLINAL